MGDPRERIQQCHEIGRDTFRFALASIRTREQRPHGLRKRRSDEHIEEMMVDIRLESRDHADDMVYQGKPYGPHAEEIVKFTGEERESARMGVALAYYQAGMKMF